MKLTAQIKLTPTPHQADVLRRTLERANAACDTIARMAWETKTFRQFPLHRLVYQDIRAAYHLSAQVTVRCIAKVANAYTLDRKTQRTFDPMGVIVYDDRILSFNLKGSSVSIWTVEGLASIPFVCGDYQRELIAGRCGASDLVFRNGLWFLFVTCETETPPPIDVEGDLGIDLGVTNSATDSDGEVHSGTAIKNNPLPASAAQQYIAAAWRAWSEAPSAYPCRPRISVCEAHQPLPFHATCGEGRTHE